MTQHKHQALPIGQFTHGFLQPAPAFVLQHLIFRARTPRWEVLRRIPLDTIRINRRPRDPPFTPPASFQPVKAAINQDAREPDLKGQILAERAHVRVGLHEGVLDRFIPVGRVAKIVKRNSSRSALMALDQGRICLPGLVKLTGGLEGLHADGNGGVGFPTGF